MTTRDKLEQVLEYIINEEQEKASDLLHDVFVEKARTVYEDLMDQDEDLEGYEEEINSDEIAEEDHEPAMDMDMDDAEGDVADDMAMDVDPEMDGEEAGPDEIESNFEKVEDAIEELRQSFQAILGGDMEEPEGDMDMSDEEMGAMDSSEEDMMDSFEYEEESVDEEVELDLSDDEDEDLEEDYDYVDEALKRKHHRKNKAAMYQRDQEVDPSVDEALKRKHHRKNKAAMYQRDQEVDPQAKGKKAKEKTDEAYEMVDEAATLTQVKMPYNTSEKSTSPVAKGSNKPGGTVNQSMMKDGGGEGKKLTTTAKVMNTGNVNVPGAKQKLSSVATPKNSDAAGNTTSPNNGM